MPEKDSVLNASPQSEKPVPAESRASMAAFEKTGFAREVLAATEEDVWNDL